MRPPQEAEMGGPEGPLTFEMLMALRNAARNRRQGSMGPQGGGLQGAAQRRLASAGPGAGPVAPVSPGEEMMPPEGMEEPGALIGDQTPEDLVLSDLQNALDAAIEPPDITQSAATTMMRYGAIQEYLARARGELPNG